MKSWFKSAGLWLLDKWPYWGPFVAGFALGKWF